MPRGRPKGSKNKAETSELPTKKEAEEQISEGNTEETKAEEEQKPEEQIVSTN